MRRYRTTLVRAINKVIVVLNTIGLETILIVVLNTICFENVAAMRIAQRQSRIIRGNEYTLRKQTSLVLIVVGSRSLKN
jgi:hypothetical protein